MTTHQKMTRRQKSPFGWAGRGAIYLDFGVTEMSQEQREMSDSIYCMAMRLTDTETPPALVDQITRVACVIAGIPYPPEILA